MTVTYDPTLADEISEIRFYIGDTMENNGPRPSQPSAANSNFSDAELTAMLGKASGDVSTCVSSLFSVLATEWTRYATIITVGPYKEDLTKLSERYRQQAQEWLDKSLSFGRAFSSGVIRRSHDTDTRFIT